jgi:hypothetical protein
VYITCQNLLSLDGIVECLDSNNCHRANVKSRINLVELQWYAAPVEAAAPTALAPTFLFDKKDFKNFVTEFDHSISHQGTVSSDFRPSIFSTNNIPRPFLHRLKPFQIWICVREDIRLQKSSPR